LDSFYNLKDGVTYCSSKIIKEHWKAPPCVIQKMRTKNLVTQVIVITNETVKAGMVMDTTLILTNALN